VASSSILPFAAWLIQQHPASPREVKVSSGRSYGDSLRRANSTARQALRLSPTLVARPKNFPKALLEIFNWLM